MAGKKSRACRESRATPCDTGAAAALLWKTKILKVGHVGQEVGHEAG